MKKTLFGLLVITLMFAFACDNKGGNNANSANNNNGGNTNANQNTNTAPLAPSPDPDTKTVVIVVTDDSSASSIDAQLLAIPDQIKLKTNQKIRWVVYSNHSNGTVNATIDSFVIDGTTTPENPFQAGSATFSVSAILPGNSNSYPPGTDTMAARPSTPSKTYKYTIHATITQFGGPSRPPLMLDPKVVVSQ